MKVSIIVPTFDREDTIERCLESALNQTYDDIEVIVVDNCSQDRTVERCRQYSGDSRLKIYENNENIGPCRNWQRCIDMSSGDFIKFLFSDDVLSPDCIEAQVNAFSRDVAFVVSPAKIYLNQSGQPTLFWTFPAGTTRVPVEQFIENSLFTSRYPVTPVCALFRTEDVRSHFNASFDAPIGGDPSEHGIGPDLLLYLQIAHSYAKLGTKSVCRLAQPLCTFPYNPSISVRSSGKRLYCYLLAKAYFVTNSAPITPRGLSASSLRIYYCCEHGKLVIVSPCGLYGTQRNAKLLMFVWGLHTGFYELQGCLYASFHEVYLPDDCRP